MWDAKRAPSDVVSALSELAELGGILDLWWPRFREPMKPSAGSLLGADDAAWRRAPLSAIAQARMAVALDELQAIRVLCEANSFHVAASPTLARSALLVASEALWMLGPELATLRQRRGLAAALEGDRQHLKYLDAVKAAPGARVDEIACLWPARSCDASRSTWTGSSTRTPTPCVRRDERGTALPRPLRAPHLASGCEGCRPRRLHFPRPAP